ncbi:MAG: coproporphyrinogen III oxidase [Alphaproteobacteria bacterium]|nr:coproporphyrinogen III oxidase [Alphaproteobacteria bacterium]
MTGFYIHWPFCAAKCPYCDFNVHLRENIDQQQMLDTYIKEMEYVFARYKTPVSSVFFGGGTPSLMSPQTVGAIIDKIQALWGFKNDIEITLEANPNSSEAQKFADFKQAGINRVSIGVQSFNNERLKFLGRIHDGDAALKAVSSAAEIFDKFSFDLIYATPKQSLDEWKTELKQALQFAKGHMSLYQLTIEKGTKFYLSEARGDFVMPDEDTGADFYEVTQEIMSASGMPAYEVSNYAANEDHQSAHNLNYWRYGDYIGIGPGAHGRLTVNGNKIATRVHRAPDIWQQRIAEQGHAYEQWESLNDETQTHEKLMMGLRLVEGMKLPETIARTKIDTLCDEGFLLKDGELVKPTRKGLACHNAVVGYLLGGSNIHAAA